MERSWKQGSARSTDVALSVLGRRGYKGSQEPGPGIPIGGMGSCESPAHSHYRLVRPTLSPCCTLILLVKS